jgi:protoheme IX farnesyltransferase
VKEARANAVGVRIEGPAPAPFGAVQRPGERRAAGTRVADFVALTKPRLNGLVVATSAVGYYLGSAAAPDLWNMAVASFGTALVAGGAAALNQVYERNTDALMRRTRTRPLPDGRVLAADARAFGIALSSLGLGVLAVRTNLLAAALAVATLAIYLVIYTPMKRRSALATLVGAVPGALPPVIGWAASHGAISMGGAVLFAIVFLWQIPHFMAIAWLYRDDYRSAGFPMLPVVEPDGLQTGRQAALYAAALLPVSLLPTFIGLSGTAYLVAAGSLGFVMLVLAIRFARERSDRFARTLFLASIVYLPLIWIALTLDKL